MKGSEAGKRGWPYLGGAVSGYRRLGVVSGYVTGSVILVRGIGSRLGGRDDEL